MPAANLIAHWPQLHGGGLILCWRRIRKFDENKQTDKEHTDNSKPEATLIPVDCRGERANIFLHSYWQFLSLILSSARKLPTMEMLDIFLKYWKLRALRTLLALAEGWGTLLVAFSPLFSSKMCQTKHTQFSIKIGTNKIFEVISISF